MHNHNLDNTSISEVLDLREAGLPRLQPPSAPVQPLHGSARLPSAPPPLHCLGPLVLGQLQLQSSHAAPRRAAPRAPPSWVHSFSGSSSLPGSTRPQAAPVLPPPLLCPGPLNLLQLHPVQSCSAALAVDNEQTARERLLIPARA